MLFIQQHRRRNCAAHHEIAEVIGMAAIFTKLGQVLWIVKILGVSQLGSAQGFENVDSFDTRSVRNLSNDAGKFTVYY